jgi:ABC-type uncharacterized transport system substrate-binding protein
LSLARFNEGCEISVTSREKTYWSNTDTLKARSNASKALVAELVQLKVDALVIIASPALRVAKQATKTIPIVMVTNVDPVATGLVDSLARPGGNIIGITRLTRELSGKRVQLLISCGYAVRVAFAESISWLTRVGNAHL